MAAGLLAAGCGANQRQDADEPERTMRVSVPQATFPRSQQVSDPVTLLIRVRNEDRRRSMPNVSVTVDGLERRSKQPGLSDPTEPVWIIDDDPIGGVGSATDDANPSATNTWSLGRVPPGGEREFRWRVTPVQTGLRTVRYRVSAGLDGKAKARTAGGRQPGGRFRVAISEAPRDARVDPETGAVVPR